MLRPSRPLGAYLLFMQDYKQTIGEHQSGELQQMWRDLAPEDRLKYSEEHQQLYAEYQREMTRYYELHPNERAEDEAEHRKRKSKQRSNLREQHARLLFAVAVLQRYMSQQDDFQVSRNMLLMIHTTFNALDEADKKKWASLWNDIDADRKAEIQALFDSWQQQQTESAQ